MASKSTVVAGCFAALFTFMVELYSTSLFLSWGYAVAILLTLFGRNEKFCIAVTVLSIGLIFSSIPLMSPGIELRTLWMNRMFAMLGVSIVGYLVLRAIVNEQQSRNQQSLMAGIFSHGTQGIVLMDQLGRIVMMNPFAQSLLGYRVEEVIRKPLDVIIPGILENHLQNQKYKPETPKLQVEATGRKKNGSEFPVELSMSRYQSGGETFFVSFLIDLTKRNEDARALQEKTIELESSNRELEAFTYSVSHDLRAPLRAVGGYAQMIQEDYSQRFDERGIRLLQNVQQNAERMGQLIDDLLTFSRLGRKEVNKSYVNMNELTKRAISDLSTSSPHKAEFKVNPLHAGWADPSLIFQVLHNLLSNAMKYSSKHPHPLIEIESRLSGDQVIYTITDNGVGFDMNYAHKLFGVFQRLHSANQFEGTGVGLAIAHRIVTKHGGKIWAHSIEGQGASFYFSLRAAKEEEQPFHLVAPLVDPLKATQYNHKKSNEQQIH